MILDFNTKAINLLSLWALFTKLHSGFNSMCIYDFMVKWLLQFKLDRLCQCYFARKSYSIRTLPVRSNLAIGLPVAETAVWPFAFLINTFTALKGSQFYFYPS